MAMDDKTLIDQIVTGEKIQQGEDMSSGYRSGD